MSHALRSFVLAVALIVGTVPAAWAQFGHPADGVAAGGETAGNASFSVRGTVGQALVDRVEGGDRGVNQGFWFAMQGEGATALFVEAVSVSGDGLVDFGPTGVDLQLSGTSGSGLMTVEAFNDGPVSPTGISEQNVSQYRFVVSMKGTLSVGSGTEVQFDVGTLRGISNPDTVAIYTRPTEDAGPFTGYSTTFDAGANELVATADTLRELVLASDTEPLPVELAHLQARTSEKTVVLRWQTASETDNAGFHVQRKTPAGSQWKNLGFVDGTGTTANPKSYRFVDENVPFAADSLTYRLRQVDTDGGTASSAPVTVHRGTPSEVQLLAPFPNPTHNRTTVRFAVPRQQEISLHLYDMLGRRVATLEQNTVARGRKQRMLKVSNLTSGVYFLRLRAEENTRTRRLTVLQ